MCSYTAVREIPREIGHFASGHSTGYAKSGHFGTQPRTLWYPAQDTTAPDTLRECLAPCCPRFPAPDTVGLSDTVGFSSAGATRESDTH